MLIHVDQHVDQHVGQHVHSVLGIYSEDALGTYVCTHIICNGLSWFLYLTVSEQKS